MAYYDALITEWSKPEYSGMTRDQKLAAINAKTVAGPDRLVQISDVMSYLRENGLWLPIKAAQASNVGAAAAVDLNGDSRAVTIDFSKPIVGQMLALLVSGNLLSQAQSDAITAMKNTTMPWWQANGYTSDFNVNDVVAGGLS